VLSTKLDRNDAAVDAHSIHFKFQVFDKSARLCFTAFFVSLSSGNCHTRSFVFNAVLFNFVIKFWLSENIAVYISHTAHGQAHVNVAKSNVNEAL
jgi:hypothetical protein